MESSFTDAEKRFVLAEMIKASRCDVGILVGFIKTHGIDPDWLSMQLPGGRNMNQCLRAAENMFDRHIPPPVLPQPFKRKSLGDVEEQISKRQAITSPPLQPRQHLPQVPPRSFSMQPINTSMVNIQPRPVHNGLAPPLPSPIPTVKVSTPTGVPARKRGRPSKADKEAWAKPNTFIQYAPISPAPVSPAPIAPHPRPTGMTGIPPVQSHAPATHPSYQISSGAAPELRSGKGNSPVAGTETAPGNVPRTAQERQGSEAVKHRTETANSVWAERWNKPALSPGQPPKPGLSPQHQAAILPAPRSHPLPRLGPVAGQETVTRELEHQEQDSQVSVQPVKNEA